MIRTGNERTGNSLLNLPVKAGAEMTEATMAAIGTDGYAAAVMAGEGLRIAGCVQKYCDNRLGGDGDARVLVKRGTFVWNNDGTIKDTDILKPCYAKNGTTVTITADGASMAGIILAVEPDGVTVDMAVQPAAQAAQSGSVENE